MSFADLLALGDRAAREILGGAVTYTPGVGEAAAVVGIFDSAYQRVEVGTPGISSFGPAVFLTLADLPSNPGTDADATITVDGVTYSVHEVQPDGLGGVMLLLHKVV